ncbi:MAG: CmpA/NrtA family ABC transporter substrate-binding protein [Pseudomonadota bacterium]
MTPRDITLAYIPLVDAAPLIVAKEMGFDREEGLRFNLMRATSWSEVRDMLVFGHAEAAHLLSPLPVAMSLGLGGVARDISALMVLSLNGNVIGVSKDLAARIEPLNLSFHDAHAVGQALVGHAAPTLRIGVPFPFSMHAELLYYWLSASGLHAPQGIDIRTVPPPFMPEALEAGEIDAFCVGEPWGSKIVERGIGTLILPGAAIWNAAPEKVLAARTEWAEAQPGLASALMRAVWKACRWLGASGIKTTGAELLSHKDYLDLPAEWIDRALSGHFVISPAGDTREVPGFLEFFAGAATFPWRSQASWIAYQMAGRLGLDRSDAMRRAEGVFRSDLYRAHLADIGAILPSASSKIEGGLSDETAVASVSGHLILGENRFFDGTVFDPAPKN